MSQERCFLLQKFCQTIIHVPGVGQTRLQDGGDASGQPEHFLRRTDQMLQTLDDGREVLTTWLLQLGTEIKLEQ